MPSSGTRIAIATLVGVLGLAVAAPAAQAVGEPVNVLPPSISGSAQQGQTVTCSTGTWVPAPTSYAYAWQRDGSAIGGATSSSYDLTAGDVGHLVTCTVVASNGVGPSLI